MLVQLGLVFARCMFTQTLQAAAEKSNIESILHEKNAKQRSNRFTSVQLHSKLLGCNNKKTGYFNSTKTCIFVIGGFCTRGRRVFNYVSIIQGHRGLGIYANDIDSVLDVKRPRRMRASTTPASHVIGAA